MIMIMDFSLDISYFSPTFMLAKFKFSIYINGIAIYSSAICSCMFTSFMISRVPRKIFGSVSFTVVFICSFVLLFIWDQDS